MKRRIFTYSTFVLLLGLSACMQDGLPADGAEGTPMTFTATGLEFPEARSRATVDGNWTGVSTVAVKIGDEVKDYTVTPSADGLSATLTSTDPFYWIRTEPVTVSAWPKADASSTDMPLVVVQEDQGGEGFAKSDFIAAEPQEVSIGTSSLKFTHRTARLTVTLTPGDGINSVEEATLKFTGLNTEGGNPASITPYHTAGTVVYEALVAPQTIAQGTAFITVTLNGTTYSYAPKTAGIELEAGSRYNYIVRVNATGLELEEVSGGEWTDSNESEDVTSKEILVRYTADDVKKGDYIYQDGTTSDGGLRLIYADGTMVTTPEKPQPKNDDANPVVGIVFWTPSETTPQTGRNTPASLEDDVIMHAEHPDCTHGLAVALKDATYNGSERMVWQYPYESVADFQSGSYFNHEQKTDFKSIASEGGATDPMNYILGYQNTVVLRAYNEYCQTNDKSDYIVKPVAAIDEFAINNPAPDNSTGWFLPSPKELHILCYKDVDDIYSHFGTDTWDIINSSLTAVGGDGLKSWDYWSSGEHSNRAWYVRLNLGLVGSLNKSNDSYVRLAFAF
ncbi:fimbrillin family protein [Phocaeicola plebeius]|uniref:fimbrillin family protein n=1 Tax=Phocaeicola plebeius TaxID=310297 RepID=UPI00307F8B7D